MRGKKRKKFPLSNVKSVCELFKMTSNELFTQKVQVALQKDANWELLQRWMTKHAVELTDSTILQILLDEQTKPECVIWSRKLSREFE